MGYESVSDRPSSGGCSGVYMDFEVGKFKTKRKHARVFKRECRRWIRFFGLHGWRVYFDHAGDDENLAWLEGNVEARAVTIGLATEWGVKPTKHKLRMVAFHEACELLLYRLHCAAKNRWATEAEMNGARHEVVQMLTNTIWKRGYKA